MDSIASLPMQSYSFSHSEETATRPSSVAKTLDDTRLDSAGRMCLETMSGWCWCNRGTNSVREGG